MQVSLSELWKAVGETCDRARIQYNELRMEMTSRAPINCCYGRCSLILGSLVHPGLCARGQ